MMLIRPTALSIRAMRSIVAIPVSALTVAASAALGQGNAVTVNGTVVDAGTATPLAGAILILAPATHGVFAPAGASPLLTGARSTSSDSLGRYEMRGVASGRYELLVKRLGYQPSVVDVDVTGGVGTANLSVGLVVVPVRLQPVSIHSNALNLFGTASADDGGITVSPAEAARARQSRFLGTDVRELTAAGVLEGSALGETDIFRALLRMPGVTGFDDRSTELWVRGGQWDQVRVAYDGLPLFNPFHAYRSMTGISGDAIGAAFLHPGVRPVSLLGQGPSLVDIRSRAPVDTSFRMMVEGSASGLAGAFEKAARDGRTGISLLGRTNIENLVAFPLLHSSWSPTSFGELALRVNHDFGNGRSLEVSDLMTRDYPRAFRFNFLNASANETPDVLRSGSHLGRATFRMDVGRLRVSQTIGFSAYEGRDYSSATPLGAYDTTFSFIVGNTVPYFSRVSFGTLRGVIEPTAATENRWTVGYELSNYRTSSIAPRHAYSWSALSAEARQVSGTLPLASIWGDRIWKLNESVSLEAGLRIESSRDELAPRLAPSLMARSRVGKLTSLSAGYSRVFQDTQELPFTTSGAYGARRGFWLVTGPGAPAMVADQVSAGVERWLGSSILLDANLYGRRLSRVAIRPLPAGDSLPRPMFLESTINSYGLELGARKLTGRLTGSVSYSYGHARQHAGGESFAASGDRTHALDATALLRLGRLRLGYAVTGMSGAPYTRMDIGFGVLAASDTINWSALSSAQPRNAQRLPYYISADAFAELSGKIFGVGVTSFFGVNNVRNRDNMTFYMPVSAVGVSKYGFFGPPDQLYSMSQRDMRLGFRFVF
jgi:hypothetical protein